MVAGQVAQRLAERVHAPVGGDVVTAGIGGQQETREAVVLVGVRQPMSGEVDQQPARGRLKGREVLGQEGGEGGQGRLIVEEAEYLESLALQRVRDGVGVPDGIGEGWDALSIGIDANDNRQTALEVWPGHIEAGVLHWPTEQLAVSRAVRWTGC